MKLHYTDPHALGVKSKPLPSARFNEFVKTVAREGIVHPVVVDGETLEVVDGEMRVLAARSAGLKEIPVVFV